MVEPTARALPATRAVAISLPSPAWWAAIPRLLEIVCASRLSPPTRRDRHQLVVGVLTDGLAPPAERLAERSLPQTHAEDAVDIRRALGGDHDAYGRLVRRYQGQLAGQIWRASRQRADYEELMQEVFVEAFQSLAKYRGDAPVLAWLRKIATRVCFRYWKRLSASASHQSFTDLRWDDVAASPDGEQRQVDSVEAVHQLLSRLSPRDRLVVTLIYLEGRSVAEAADLAGWSQTMVKVQCFRARKKLQKILGPQANP